MSSRILYWNANGLLRNKDALVSLLTCPHSVNNAQPSIDIITLAETHIQPGYSCPPVYGYNVWSQNHAGNSGGVAIYVRDTLIARGVPKYDYRDDNGGSSMVMWLAVRPFPRSRTEALVAVVYVQPCIPLARVKALLDSIRRVTDTHSNQPILITGDFNSRDPLWGDTTTSATAPTVRRFLSDADLYTLNQHFIRGRPTRTSSDPNVPSSIIDLVITNKPELVGDMIIADEYDLHSDHLPLLVEIVRRPTDVLVDGPANHLDGHRIQWRTRTADWDAFAELIDRSIATDSLTAPIPLPSGGRSPQSIVDERSRRLHKALMDAAHAAVGVQPHRAEGGKFWWNCPLVDMTAIYRAYRTAITRYKRCRPADRAAAGLARHAARKVYRTALRTAKDWARAELFRNVESSPHILNWLGYRRTLPRANRVNLNSVTNEAGALPLNTNESLINFATAMFKAAVPPQRSTAHDQITARVDAAAQRYVADPSEDTLNWSCTADDVERICVHISVGRAYGSDHVHPAFLKYGGKPLYRALSVLFNYSYRHSVIPLQWTQSLVVPLYKDGDTTSASSYRPISLTSCIVRTMEHLVQERLIAFVDSRLHPYQYGFRPRHSTHNAIHHMLEDLHTVSRQKPQSATPVVFLDLRKAFDRVWHVGLLDMLRQRGICGRIWLWLRAFISNRCSCVVNNGSSSGWFLQRYGVPQGAVLSPILFNIFFDKLAEALSTDPRTLHITLLGFADDAAIYPDVRTSDWNRRLQTALRTVGAWSRCYCMEFNSKKSQVVWYTRKRGFVPRQRYQLTGFDLEAVDSYRYLGLHLSGDFTWKTHTSTLVKRACHDAFLVRRLIDHKSQFPIHFGTIRTVANSYLLPRWTYGLALMPPTKSVRHWLERAESELCSTIRAVLGLPRSTHKLSVLIEAGFMPMTVYADYQRLRLAYNMSQLPPRHATAHRYADGLRDARADDQRWTSRIAAGTTSLARRNQVDPLHIRSFYRVISSIQSAWGVMHQSIDDIARKAVATAYTTWTASTGGGVLKSIRLYRDSRQIGRSQYLYLDTAVHARVRAAFRLDRIQTNGSMFRMNHGRYGTTSTPDCPCCPGVEESIPHIVNDCPLYSLHRAIISRMASVPIGPMFINFVLGGAVTHTTARAAANTMTKRRRELRLSGDFLVSILVTRGVPPR